VTRQAVPCISTGRDIRDRGEECCPASRPRPGLAAGQRAPRRVFLPGRCTRRRGSRARDMRARRRRSQRLRSSKRVTCLRKSTRLLRFSATAVSGGGPNSARAGTDVPIESVSAGRGSKSFLIPGRLNFVFNGPLPRMTLDFCGMTSSCQHHVRNLLSLVYAASRAVVSEFPFPNESIQEHPSRRAASSASDSVRQICATVPDFESALGLSSLVAVQRGNHSPLPSGSSRDCATMV